MIFHHHLMILFLLPYLNSASQEPPVKERKCVLNVMCSPRNLDCVKNEHPPPIGRYEAYILHSMCPSLFDSISVYDNFVPMCCTSFEVYRLKMFFGFWREHSHAIHVGSTFGKYFVSSFVLLDKLILLDW